MKCNSTQDITSFLPSETMIEDKFNNQAFLPPVLADVLFNLEDFGAKTILLRFIKKIRSIKKDSCQTKENITLVEEEEWEDITNTSPNADSNLATEITEQGDDIFDDLGRPYELKFGKVLKLLWGAIHQQDKLVLEVHLHPCSLPSTTAWLNKVHDNILEKLVNKNIILSHPKPQIL